MLLQDMQTGAPQPLLRFMLRTNTARSIPRPGNVDIIAGAGRPARRWALSSA